MKSKFLATALIAGISAAALGHAEDADKGGFFVNGNIGQSNLSKGAYDDSDTGYGANIGYRWAINPNVALGVEGGYTDLGKFKTKDSLAGLGLPKAQVSGWTAGVNGHFNFTPEWYVSGRAGLFRADVKGTYYANGNYGTTGATPVYVDDTSTKYYAGAGVGYDFSNNLSVGVNYDYYKADKTGLYLAPSLVSVSGEFRF